MSKIEVPIWEKITITVDEAAAYSGISRDHIYQMTKDINCDFVIMVGRKNLIKRKKFEKYIESICVI